MDVDRIIQIAEELNLSDKVNELKFYAERLKSKEKDLVLPLVGEFSSGKTTLINSLLDNPNLETASRATTASIFEIRFGSEECEAFIVNEDGSSIRIEDVSDIKNDKLHECEVVKVYDSSKRIGESTILVDTPGLSSNDPAHRIALSSYLPNADAILLLTDVNQQITRSLLEFLHNSKIANKPIYGIVTKSDTKTPEEVESVKEYIKKTIEVPFERIISISATKGDLTEFDEIIQELQANKNLIVENSVNERIKGVTKEISDVIKNLIKESNSQEEIEDAIEEEQRKLEKLNRNIDSLLKDAESRIKEKSNKAVSLFAKTVFSQVDDIVKAQGRDSSDSVNCAVNSAAVMIMQNYQKDVMTDILQLARSRQNRLEEVPMGVLETIDITGNSFNGFSSAVDLASVGHEWDRKIGYGVIAAVAIGATIVTAGAATPAAAAASGGAAATGSTVAGGAAVAGGASAAGGAATAVGSAGTVIAADVITDVAATAYTSNKINKLTKIAKISEKAKKAKDFVDDVKDNLDETQKYNQELGEKTGMKRGVIETSVGWVTDFFAKPARQRAVNNYIDGTLVPEFKQQIFAVKSTLFREISSLLRNEAINNSESIRKNLKDLKDLLSEQREEYSKKMNLYKQYLIELNEI